MDFDVILPTSRPWLWHLDFTMDWWLGRSFRPVTLGGGLNVPLMFATCGLFFTVVLGRIVGTFWVLDFAFSAFEALGFKLMYFKCLVPGFWIFCSWI